MKRTNVPNTPETIAAAFVVDESTGCHLWTGTCDKDGYPLVKYKGKTHRATRLLWTFRHGPIPEGQNVLHDCDTPACTRDDHHFLGDTLANNRDCVAKGRHAHGVTHGRHTRPERTARGARHGSVTHPEAAPRGEQHWHYGKPASTERGSDGRFKA